MKQHFAFAIVGAGPAGTTCTNALLQNGGADIALIDKACFPRDKICGDGIGPGVIAVLDALDLCGVLDGHRRVERMVVTSPLGRRMVLEAGTLDRPMPLGYVVPRVIFDNALFEAAVDRGAADLTGWSLETASRIGGRWDLTLAAKGAKDATSSKKVRTITADVLIGADGATSRVRRLLGQPLNEDKHNSIAVRVLANTDRSFPAHQEINVVEGLPRPGYGWIFFSGSGQANVGCGCDIRAYRSEKRNLLQLLEFYKAYLETVWPGVLSYDDTTCHTAPLPLASKMPQLAFPDQNAALIGDAASMINPLTGEGIFYGMEAGLRLGCRLAESQRRNSTQSAADALSDFETNFRRKFSAHFRGNYLLRHAIDRRRLMEIMVEACAADDELCCDYIEYMLGNEKGGAGKPLFQIALKTILDRN